MSTTPSPDPQLDGIPAVELLKTRSQLAWNWFEFHARQRMTMFNNFLIITGILVNGALSKNLWKSTPIEGVVDFKLRGCLPRASSPASFNGRDTACTDLKSTRRTRP